MFLELRQNSVVAYGVKKLMSLETSVFLFLAKQQGKEVHYKRGD